MIIRRFQAGRQRRGVAILAFTVILTVIAAITAMMLSGTLMDQSRINDRRRALWRAFLHAEAGIAQVQHWAMHPADYTEDTSFWVKQNGSTPAEKYPGIQAALDGGGLTITDQMLADMGNDLGMPGPVGEFETETGWGLGRIAQIEILPLDGSEPASASGAFFKIVSLGEAAQGVQREVIGYARLTNVVNIQLPAPLISMDSAQIFGNGMVHWGEAWAKAGINLQNKSAHSYILDDPDPLAVWRTEGTIHPSGGSWKWGTNSNNKDFNSNYLSQSASPIGRRPGLFDDGNGDWKDAFYTHVPEGVLDWPELADEYQTFKDMAKANGRYYTTDSSGNLYDDNGNQVDFYTEFTVLDRQNAPLDLAFIDTTDQNPPEANGSNLATIHVSGNSQGLKGFLYINANFDASGVGSPPSLTAVNPNTDNYETLEKMFLDGVIYAAGTINMSGNAGVYGSIVAERGFVGGGTPDIYYNTDLADGLDLGGGNLGSPFIIQLHNNLAP